MTIRLQAWLPDKSFVQYESVESLKSLPLDAKVWLDIEAPDGAPLEVAAKHFGLHELAVEDCLTPGHFPKIEDYGDYLFIVTRAIKSPNEIEQIWSEVRDGELSAASLLDEDEGKKFTRKVAIFLAPDFLITFRRYPIAWLDALGRQVQQHPATSLGAGTDLVCHHVVDALTDRFSRGMGFFEELIDDLEYQILDDPSAVSLGDVAVLKKELLVFRHVLRDQRLVVSRLVAEPGAFISKQRRRYFSDVGDHTSELIDTIEREIDSLNSLRDTFFAAANTRLSSTMRVLAIITTVAAPLHLIVGVYGMNFASMPLLNDPYGFWITVSGMLITAALMLLFFKRMKWI